MSLLFFIFCFDSKIRLEFFFYTFSNQLIYIMQNVQVQIDLRLNYKYQLYGCRYTLCVDEYKNFFFRFFFSKRGLLLSTQKPKKILLIKKSILNEFFCCHPPIACKFIYGMSFYLQPTQNIKFNNCVRINQGGTGGFVMLKTCENIHLKLSK